MIALQQSIAAVAIARRVEQEVDVDHFAGFGGWAEGFRQATRRSPGIACNHDLHAITTHQLNHPDALHFREDVRHLCAVTVLAGRTIRWLHGSPDCTHHSKAKGGKPRRQAMRGLAWHLLPWIFHGKARFFSLENVAEFVDWGPLRKGKPIKRRKGETFRAFKLCLTTGLPEDDPTWPEIRKEIGTRMPMEALSRGLGLRIDHQELAACDYGAPTIRKRLFIIGRRDGLPIVWPSPTHGPGTRRKYRTAGECIDWSNLGLSIFARTEAGKKELAEPTKRRIAAGAVRYVLEAARPYLVLCNHSGGFRGQSIDQPMSTVTASRDARGLVVPMLVQTGYGERAGQSPRALDLDKPLGTIVAGGVKHALAGCLIKGYTGEGMAADLRVPLPTITTRDHNWLLAAHIGTIDHQSNANGGIGATDEPLSTVTTKQRHTLVAAHLMPFYSRSKGADMADPMPTVTAQSNGGHQAMCSYLVAYYGSEKRGQALGRPMRTVTCNDRMALCNLITGGDLAGALRVGRFLLRYAPEATLWWIRIGRRLRPVAVVMIDGQGYAITDLLFRMLKPMPELLLAQGFRRDYQCPGTQEQQTERIGNSVPPQFAKAIVRANLAEELQPV